MRTKLSISILFCIIAVSTWAQTYKNTYTPSAQQEHEVIQSQQIMTTSAHGGTIYEPFSSAAPSEQSGVGAEQTAPSGPNRAKQFDTGGDAGQGPSPLGDGLLALLLMSLAFAGVIYFRKRQARA